MTRPRVLLLHYTFPSVPGGVEIVLARHAAGLRDAGADVTFAAGRGTLRLAGVRTRRIAELDSRDAGVERVYRALARGDVPDELATIRDRLVARLRPILARADRVVAHNVLTLHKNAPLTLALHALAPSLPPGRLIVWVHDLAWVDRRYLAQRHPGEPWDVFTQPIPGARYVAVSETRREETSRLLRLPPESIEVVPNGVDVDVLLRMSPQVARLVRSTTLADADVVLLLPARLTRRKRVEIAIAAASELRRRGTRAVLLVTGAPGPHDRENAAYLAELRRLAARSNGAALLLYDEIGRLPYRTVAELFGIADALVFPSEHEGFGIPMLEAAIARLPIVCSDIPAHRATLGDEATYVAPDADPKTLADAIASTLGSDRAYRVRERVRKAYDWERVLRERVVPLVLGERAGRKTA